MFGTVLKTACKMDSKTDGNSDWKSRKINQKLFRNLCFFSHEFSTDLGSTLDGLVVGLGGQLRPNMDQHGFSWGHLEPTWLNMGQAGANLKTSGVQLGANLSRLGPT